MGERDTCILYRHKDGLGLKCTGLCKTTVKVIDFLGNVPELDDPMAFRMFYKEPYDISIGKWKVRRWRLSWKQF